MSDEPVQHYHGGKAFEEIISDGQFTKTCMKCETEYSIMEDHKCELNTRQTNVHGLDCECDECFRMRCNAEVFACPECSRQFVSRADAGEHWRKEHEVESE